MDRDMAGKRCEISTFIKDNGVDLFFVIIIIIMMFILSAISPESS